MKWKTTFLILILAQFNAIGQENKNIEKEIAQQSKNITRLILSKESNKLINLYADDLTYFPEYKPAIFSKKDLQDFFKQWFSQTSIISFERKSYKVEPFKQNVLEVGTLKMICTDIATGKEFEYRGKYMMIWTRSKSGKLKILSEAFGSDKYIEPGEIPFSKVAVEEKNPEPNFLKLDKQLLSEIELQNSQVIDAVVKGDGAKRAEGFSEKGIYMPHFESILSGMEIIRPYMLKTYSPEAKLKVKHTFFKIYDFGELILLNGHFDGSWGDERNGGLFSGNMSNLFIRENGKLLMYCQLVNNDKKS